MKKVTAILASSILALTMLVGCGEKKNNTEGVKSAKVRVAIQNSLGASGILVAKEKGFLVEELKPYGVEIEWTNFAAGPPMNESFAAGQQDIGFIGDVPLLVAKASGQETKAIANAGYNPNTSALVVAKDSSITDVAQLKGKKVAYVKGSFGHHLLGLLLEKAGLSFSDIQEINLPVTDIANTVQSGQADAGIIWDPNLIKSINAGQVKVLADGTNIKRNSCYYFATENYIKDNPKVIEAYIKAINKSYEFIKSNPDEAANLIADITKLSKEEVLDVFSKYTYEAAIDEVDINELKQVESFLRDQKLTTAKVDIDSFVDTQHLKNVGLQ